ncbi:MAG TPA: hypothetical protein VIF62_26645, partial [Labilithrix sp.]
AGSRVVRYPLADKGKGEDLVDAGVGRALSEMVEAASDGGVTRWLAWMDAADHAHLLPLSRSLSAGGAATLEPALDGARVLGASGDFVFVLAGSAIKRFQCVQARE